MENVITNLRIAAEKAWDNHFDECSNQGVWTKLNASLTDIKIFEQSWKIRWIESKLDELANPQP
jgi:hypothetical protein